MRKALRALVLGVLIAGAAAGSWVFAAGGARGGANGQSAASREPSSHDPVIIKQGDYYYVFSTGGGGGGGRGRRGAIAATASATTPAPARAGAIPMLRSKDLLNWESLGFALPAVPAWIADSGITTRSLWAPDISFHNGKYQLYYAGSSFGRNTSVIGLATNTTLDPSAPGYKWVDQGLVVSTRQGDDYNAIDPNFATDEEGKGWLVFGSFWSGIKMVKLNEKGLRDETDKTVYAVASRKEPPRAVEAPFIIREGKWYYLFVSFDVCCEGLRSTYRIMVGRAEKITGPYTDKDGKRMLDGGGTELLKGDGDRIIAPGHCGLIKDGDKWIMVHHFLDGHANGAQRLQVRPMTFDLAGWPVLGAPVK